VPHTPPGQVVVVVLVAVDVGWVVEEVMVEEKEVVGIVVEGLVVGRVEGEEDLLLDGEVEESIVESEENEETLDPVVGRVGELEWVVGDEEADVVELRIELDGDKTDDSEGTPTVVVVTSVGAASALTLPAVVIPQQEQAEE